MKGVLILCTTLVMMIAFACGKGDLQNQEQDEARLKKMRQEILDKANKVACNDAKDWHYVALGSKACGGPVQYIAYPLTIDTDNLLSLIEHYNEAQKAYIKKYGISSDCMMVMPPSGVICEDGKPKLIYSIASQG